MKKLWILFFLISLTACQQLEGPLSGSAEATTTSSFSLLEDSSISVTNLTDSVVTTSNNADTSTTTAPSSGWNSAIRAEMLLIIETEIPYISQFGQNYQYETGFIYDSTIPYINPFIKNASNWVSAYQSALVSSGYAFDESDNEEGTIWYYYEKELASATVIVKFSYYSAEGSNWFDIYAYLEGEHSSAIPVPDTFDIMITPDHFPKKYADSVTTVTVDSYSFSYRRTMTEAYQIQLGSKEGEIYNTNPINNLSLLYLEGLNYIERVTVYKGNNLSSLTVVTSYNLVYDLSGASYFKIIANKTGTTGVVRLDAIGITLSK